MHLSGQEDTWRDCMPLLLGTVGEVNSIGYYPLKSVWHLPVSYRLLFVEIIPQRWGKNTMVTLYKRSHFYFHLKVPFFKK